MNEMVERVTKAIESVNRQWGADFKDTPRRSAVAAIEAMLNPTEEMLKFGIMDLLFFGPGRANPKDNYKDLRAAWQTMIKTAVKYP